MEQTEYHESRLGYEIAIDEMRLQLEEQSKSITAVKKITEIVFTASSLIISLIGALGLFRAPVSSDFVGLYNALIIIAMLLYIVLIVLSIWVMQPVKVYGPIKPDWDVLQDYYINFADDVAVLKQQLSSYLKAIQSNEPIISQRSKRAKCTSLILPVIVVILFFLSLIRG